MAIISARLYKHVVSVTAAVVHVIPTIFVLLVIWDSFWTTRHFRAPLALQNVLRVSLQLNAINARVALLYQAQNFAISHLRKAVKLLRKHH